jgi:hypothetical protein
MQRKAASGLYAPFHLPSEQRPPLTVMPLVTIIGCATTRSVGPCCLVKPRDGRAATQLICFARMGMQSRSTVGQQPVSGLSEQKTDAIAAAQRRRLKERGMTVSLTVLALSMIAAMATRTLPTPDLQAASTFAAAVAGVSLVSAAGLWARHNGTVHLEVHNGQLQTELDVPPNSRPLQHLRRGAVTVRSCYNSN